MSKVKYDKTRPHVNVGTLPLSDETKITNSKNPKILHGKYSVGNYSHKNVSEVGYVCKENEGMSK